MTEKSKEKQKTGMMRPAVPAERETMKSFVRKGGVVVIGSVDGEEHKQETETGQGE